MTSENVTAARYLDRSGDFIRSASVVCSDLREGWLPSACLLLGFACELLAKQRLILDGVSVECLRSAPYGHDISTMWREMTALFDEAEKIAAELKRYPNENGVDAVLDCHLHFEQLAKGHSREGDYSLRYHQGEITFADPKGVTVVLASIWQAEQ